VVSPTDGRCARTRNKPSPGDGRVLRQASTLPGRTVGVRRPRQRRHLVRCLDEIVRHQIVTGTRRPTNPRYGYGDQRRRRKPLPLGKATPAPAQGNKALPDCGELLLHARTSRKDRPTGTIDAGDPESIRKDPDRSPGTASGTGRNEIEPRTKTNRGGGRIRLRIRGARGFRSPVGMSIKYDRREIRRDRLGALRTHSDYRTSSIDRNKNDQAALLSSPACIGAYGSPRDLEGRVDGTVFAP